MHARTVAHRFAGFTRSAPNPICAMCNHTKPQNSRETYVSPSMLARAHRRHLASIAADTIGHD